MTLDELTTELRKIFKFDFLTISESSYNYIDEFIAGSTKIYAPRFELWKFNSGRKNLKYDKEYNFWYCNNDGGFDTLNLWNITKWTDIDLSEYKHENGTLDYSRCIVRVK